MTVTLQERIQNDIKAAMLSKDAKKLLLLRVVKSEITRIAKELHDDDIIKILKKMRSNAEIMSNEDEIKILETYLPAMLEPAQIKTIISGIINKNNYSGMKDMGKVMNELKTYASTIDGAIASKFVKELLG